ncbi:MAG: portal protein [Vicinamibacterales bacterium]
MPTRKPVTDKDVDVSTTSAVPKQDSPEGAATKKNTEKVLERARKQARAGFAAWNHFRENARLDARFHAGTWGDTVTYQWPTEIAQKRRAQGRAVITVNRAPGFVRLVTNQARQANLRIIVKPVDDDSDVRKAEVIQGLIRNVEVQSFAERAYNKGSEKQAEQGLGFIRLMTEWAPGKTFRQRIRMKRETNPLSIMLDPTWDEPDASDAKWAFKFTAVDKEEYQQLFDREPPEAASLEAEDDRAYIGDWFPNGKIGIAEYFNREAQGKQKIAQLENGDTIDYPDIKMEKGQGGKFIVPAGTVVNVVDGPHRERTVTTTRPLFIKRDRTVTKYVMMWRKIDALHILEESVWEGGAQPFIPVIGREFEDDGVRDFRGVIRDSKSSGQIYNVLTTGLVEAVGLGTKAPVVGFKGQFGKPGEPQRLAWETANTEPHPFLEVDLVSIDGKPVNIHPQAVRFEPPIEGTVVGIKQADDDYKSTAGFRDASLAERGPQESGKAILARQRQDELGSSDYLDNLRFAIGACGRQLINLFRVVYDEPTVLRITGKDEKQRKVLVFSGATKDPRRDEFLRTDESGNVIPFQAPDGVAEDDIFDLSVGEFDVEVSAGPDPGTRRQEELQFMGELMKTVPPEVMVNFLDLLFALIDSSKGQQMAERAKKLLPKQFQDENEEGGGAPQVDPAMFEQLVAQHKAAIETIRKLEDPVMVKQMELRSKEKVELMKLYKDIMLLLIKEEGEDQRAMLQTSVQRLETMLSAQESTLDRADSRAAELTSSAMAAAERATEREAESAAAAGGAGAPAA